MNHNKTSLLAYQKRALLLAALLTIVGILSLLCILFLKNDTNNTQEMIIADIYQNGTLLESITLSSVEETYTFTITGDNGATNEIEVCPGSIGIISASCPDKLCVHQGFISNSLLPITCLPNRLVIQIRTEAQQIAPDIISY